jgi:hypothetical protein
VPVLLVTTRERGEPVPGAVRLAIFAAALIAVTIAFVQVEPWGWGWTGFVVVLATGAVLRLVSPWRSHLPPAAASWFALAGCLATLAFLLPQYFELARGLSPLRGAVLTLTLAVPAVAGWALGWRASGRLGLRTLSLGGYACAALGLAALGTLDADSRYALIVLALVLVGSGLGLAAGAVWSTPVTESLGGRVAAALTGASLGLAMAGAGFQQAQADERGAGASFEQALAVGVGWAALLLIALLAAAAPQAWRLGRRDR